MTADPDTAKADALATLRERCITPYRRLGHAATDAAADGHLVDAVMQALSSVVGLAELFAAADAYVYIDPHFVGASVPGHQGFIELPLLADLAEIQRALTAQRPVETIAASWMASGAQTAAGMH